MMKGASKIVTIDLPGWALWQRLRAAYFIITRARLCLEGELAVSFDFLSPTETDQPKEFER